MLADVLMNCTGQMDIIHKSMPGLELQSGDEGWWDYRAYGPDTKFIVIMRRVDIAKRSASEREHPLYGMPSLDKVFDRAIESLAFIPDAYWVSYEAIITDPVQQFENITDWLGLPAELSFAREDVRDEDEKWLR